MSDGCQNYDPGQRPFRTRISPKMARLLTTAIVRNTNKFYPDAGMVGVYPFDGARYRNKKELREAVSAFCETLTYDQIPLVKKNLGLI